MVREAIGSALSKPRKKTERRVDFVDAVLAERPNGVAQSATYGPSHLTTDSARPAGLQRLANARSDSTCTGAAGPRDLRSSKLCLASTQQAFLEAHGAS